MYYLIPKSTRISMSSTEEQIQAEIEKTTAHLMKLAEEANGKPLTQTPNLLVPMKKRPRKQKEEE
jgi:hypothetical protein